MSPNQTIQVLDVSTLRYEERVCAAAVQGLVNRETPRVFLDYGYYDDASARRTNELFMDDDHWFGKYRRILGNQDQNNLEYYCREHSFEVKRLHGLEDLIKGHLHVFNGYVLWDDQQPDTINIAAMLAALEGWVPVSPDMEDWIRSFGLPLRQDLRGKWKDRAALYAWAFEHLFPRCKEGFAACLEPGWKRPEFLDYVVQNQIFTYSLAGSVKGLGSTLLLLLSFGPAWLREFLFALHLDGLLKRLSLAWMGWKSAEVKLGNRIQRAVKARPYPTLFGWHTCRDDELSFMFQLSANGLRLVPSHLAGNFSFHSKVKPLGQFTADPLPQNKLDPEGIYVTFTLSDGDQLMMMNTSELGGWRSPKRGSVPFNWETQPLLVDLAPALLERFSRTKTENDCLIAGPSGAGYIVPPLAADFKAYMRSTVETCRKAGIRVVTSYVADPPRRIRSLHAQEKDALLGFLSGYAAIKRTPMELISGTPFVANQMPLVENIWDEPEQLFKRLEETIAATRSTPRFIGVHLFAYRTSYEDVAGFIQGHHDTPLHFVRADEFLYAAEQYLSRSRK